jgi:hypothetical protein
MRYTGKNPNGINQINSGSVAVSVTNVDVAVFTTSSLDVSGSLNLANTLTAPSALITGNVTVLGTASINTLVVNQTQLSTGSNQLGDAANDTQTLYGTVVIPTGSLTVTGSSIMSGSLNVTGSVNILTGGGYLSLKALGGGSTQIEGSSTLGLNPLGALDFYRNGVLHSRIANSTSNWLIGTTTDSGFKLDVNGTGRFSGNVQITGSATNSLLVKGSGTTSATTSLLVQNSAGTSAVTVKDDLTSLFGGTVQIYNTGGGYLDVRATSTSGRAIFNISDTNQNSYMILNYWGSASGQGVFNNSFITSLSGANYYFQTATGVPSAPSTAYSVFLSKSISFNSVTEYASAQIAIDSTTKGFLPPRMTTTQRDAIATPATGLKVYNTTTNTTDTYDGATWQRFGQQTLIKGSGTTSSTTALLVQNANASSSLQILDDGTATITNNNTASLQVINSNTSNVSSSAIYASARSGGGGIAIGVYGTSISGINGYGGYFVANGNGNANRTYVGVYGSSVVASSNSTQVGGSFRVEGGYTSGSVTGVLSTVDTIIEGGTNHLYRGVLGTTTNFYVDTTGSGYFANNILIGTTSSLGYKLNISGSGNFTNNLTVTGSFTVTTGSLVEFQVNQTGVKIGNATTDLHSVTGSIAVSASAGTGSALTVYKSGSTIMSIQGSQGELFSITDSLSGSLFSVSNISGLPILEVFSDNTVLLGSYLDPMLITTQRLTANSGSTVIYSLPTASYDGVFVDYVIRSGSNARAGQFMGMWSGSSTNIVDSSTTDFGDTSGFVLGLIVTGSNMVITGSASTSAWTVRAGIRSI